MSQSILIDALPGATFGKRLTVTGDAAQFVASAEAETDSLLTALYDGHGLMLVQGLAQIASEPELLLRLSKLFGNDVEDYRFTTTPKRMVHPTVPEIFVVSNTPPFTRLPPARPEPPLTEDGRLPVQFPHRVGWHTDQSYRRPPPDISLFYCETPAPFDQAQTLYADGIAAYAALPDEMKAKIDSLQALHVRPRSGRSPILLRKGKTPSPLTEFEQPQPQTIARRHPVTGETALFLCEYGQLDWEKGPIVGMEPGPDGEGGALVMQLMAHYTDPRFVYVHRWQAGDLIVYDNRCTVHCATWFDAEQHNRIMWRTTVRGNPGSEYAGEAASWLAKTD